MSRKSIQWGTGREALLLQKLLKYFIQSVWIGKILNISIIISSFSCPFLHLFLSSELLGLPGIHSFMFYSTTLNLWQCIKFLAHYLFFNQSEFQRSEEEGNSLGCSSSPSLRILKYLDRICDDCYMLYRDSDVYQLCRLSCKFTKFQFHRFLPDLTASVADFSLVVWMS